MSSKNSASLQPAQRSFILFLQLVFIQSDSAVLQRSKSWLPSVTMFKIIAVFFLSLASASAFAPAGISVASTARMIRLSSTVQHAIADRIFGLDLFAPNADQNDYGARGKKNLKVGQLTSSSYIPNGLTKAQYEKIRTQEQAKKAQNYQKNVKKAFQFQDFTEWYVKRGTDLTKGKNSWVGSTTLGHSMAKTKFDWSGTEQAKKFESTTGTDKFMASFQKTTATKKTKISPVSKKVSPQKRSFLY